MKATILPKKKQIHGLAISSLLLGIIGLFIPYLLWYIGFGLCWNAEWIDLLFAQILAVLSLISFIGAGGVSVTLGIFALIKIKRSKDAFSGIGLSIAGIISGTATLLLFVGVAESLFWIFKGLSGLFA
jgi:hypothetical protein